MGEEDERLAISQWLPKTGYPLEHVAGKMLRDAGYAVEPGMRYAESATDDARETDVVADEPTATGGVQVRLVIECKHTDGPGSFGSCRKYRHESSWSATF